MYINVDALCTTHKLKVANSSYIWYNIQTEVFELKYYNFQKGTYA